ncbi:hypothetical protein ACLOJK_015541 [Asimina triloba]
MRDISPLVHQVWKIPSGRENCGASGWKLMMEKEKIMEIPPKQRMEQHEMLLKEHRKEHNAALYRAVALDVPHTYSPSYGTFNDNDGDGPTQEGGRAAMPETSEMRPQRDG